MSSCSTHNHYYPLRQRANLELYVSLASGVDDISLTQGRKREIIPCGRSADCLVDHYTQR